MTTATSSPRARRAEGREPTTSDSPPVLASGAASDETIRTRATTEIVAGEVGQTIALCRLPGQARGTGREAYPTADSGGPCTVQRPLQTTGYRRASGPDCATDRSLQRSDKVAEPKGSSLGRLKNPGKIPARHRWLPRFGPAAPADRSEPRRAPGLPTPAPLWPSRGNGRWQRPR